MKQIFVLALVFAIGLCCAVSDWRENTADAGSEASQITSAMTVLCWFDALPANDTLSYTEIQIKDYPSISFKSNGWGIYIEYKEDGVSKSKTLLGGMPVWNAYFVDLNGDGYAELCATVSYGSGLIDEHIVVCDLIKDETYTLWERGEYDYILVKENGQLFVQKSKYGANRWPLTSKETIKAENGILAITDGTLVFMPV